MIVSALCDSPKLEDVLIIYSRKSPISSVLYLGAEDSEEVALCYQVFVVKTALFGKTNAMRYCFDSSIARRVLLLSINGNVTLTNSHCKIHLIC